jgi:hypothetical protein
MKQNNKNIVLVYDDCHGPDLWINGKRIGTNLDINDTLECLGFKVENLYLYAESYHQRIKEICGDEYYLGSD